MQNKLHQALKQSLKNIKIPLFKIAQSNLKTFSKYTESRCVTWLAKKAIGYDVRGL